MKTIVILILMLFGVTKGYCQNYLISFEGTGASTTIDSVRVENLTQGTSILVPSSDQLWLATEFTGINTISVDTKSTLRIYPNPTTEYSVIEFDVIQSGIATLEVFDLSGRKLAQKSSYVAGGKQSFLISGLGKNIYAVRVNTEDCNYNGKIIGQSPSKSNVQIMHDEKSEYIERTVINHLKSTQAEIFMQYNNGDRLKLTGMSGDYSTVISDIPVESKTITFTFIECKDGDNNNYSVVNIGTQTWMAENLNYDVGSGNWVYDNNTSNAATYGRLYNWETAMNGAGSSSTNPSGVQGVCPSSWHLPSDAEWKELEKHLGMKQSDADDWEWRGTDEGSQLKSTSGWNSYGNGTNESGFTALPSGYRTNTGNFESIADLTYYWSSTQFPGLSDWLWSRKLDYSHEGIGRNSNIKSSGFSIRCVKD